MSDTIFFLFLCCQVRLYIFQQINKFQLNFILQVVAVVAFKDNHTAIISTKNETILNITLPAVQGNT